ncbi:hypothetical protein RhiirA4_394105, partial [Rhizophagus irregularis]
MPRVGFKFKHIKHTIVLILVLSVILFIIVNFAPTNDGIKNPTGSILQKRAPQGEPKKDPPKDEPKKIQNLKKKRNL